MKKIRAISLILLLIINLVAISQVLTSPQVVETNSDWDSSYSSYSIQSSNSSFERKDSLIIISVIIGMLVLGIIFQMFKNKNKQEKEEDGFIEQMGDYDEEVQKYFPGMTEQTLINQLFNQFIEIQKAWMEFDYKSLKKLCSSELYESYNSDLEVLKKQNGKNIMSDFKLITANIKGINQENNTIIIKMYLYTSFYDYIINTKTNEYIKGNKNTRVHNQYNLEFIVNFDNKITKCPNCGADIQSSDSECSYCHTKIIGVSNNIVLSNKTTA